MRKDNIVENYHGTQVADPYRWLEDSLSPESQAWIEEQNRITREFLNTPLRDQLKRRLTELWNYPKYDLPKEVKGRLFFQKNDGLQNQAVLYVQDKGGKPVQVLDPNTFSADGTVALSGYGVSKDGKKLAYTTSASGSDWQQIRIRNVDSCEEYPETINWCRFTSLPWTPDGQGLYYSRFPEPGTVAPEEQSNYCHVCYHKLGTSQEEDILVFEMPEDKELGFTPFITEDGQYLVLVVYRGTSPRNRFYYRPLSSNGEFVRLLDREDAAYWFIGSIGTRFFFHTDLDAPRGRIIAIDIDRPHKEKWQEIVAEDADVIDGAEMVGGHLVITYMHHAQHRVEVFTPQGDSRGELSLPEIGAVLGVSGQFDNPTAYLVFTSFLYPPALFSFDLPKGELKPFGESGRTFDPQQFEVSQVFYTSKDGTRVPMFITHKKGLALDGGNPAVLYGYGGFNISMTPGFSPTQLMFLERGGVYAIACLRGGSEYGEEWHLAGMLENKQNVFDDFAAAGEWLIANKYTGKNRLAIMGRSNGGLLVGASITQRPDLFGAAVCWVPVIDMLRYHRFTVGRYWIPEYGNAEENPEHFRFMYAYSPLHNVRKNVDYPPTLIMTADTDDRVVPGHALKFAATLHEKYTGNNPILLRVEMKAGHGHGKPVSKLIDEAADIYAFLFKVFGL